MEEIKGDKFAGKTASGSKVHRCHRRTGSACWDYTSNRMPYFAPVKGRVRRQDLCRKCWGSDPQAEWLANFGLELIP